MRIISVVGYKKSGKTALVERLVKALSNYGSVGTIKHLHEHTINKPDTDSWKHANAGADVVVACTPNELVKFSRDNNLISALDELANAGMELAVVEGFKDSKLPKIALGELRAPDIIKRLDNPESADIEELVNIVLKQPEYHTLESLIHKLRRSKDIEKAGAIGTFTGIVRAITEGTRTEFLEFEGYNEVAQQKIDEICAQLKEKEGIIDVLMHHRTGIIKASEDIVYIVVAASHRERLFPVLREAIERLKVEVPIWKKEHTLGGEWWVHDK
ncbi:MAG: molybdopterin synthase [Euryarchaeota archaeon]|nr:molybdopterin synthase [Euryarchaeota archaeon]MBU4491410.1 molybdopterin synthase [Euryarchaeota archaeon]MCG2728155.1 molybdopterin synthase [Candidatus Methanoperedenaceae archaeon]